MRVPTPAPSIQQLLEKYKDNVGLPAGFWHRVITEFTVPTIDGRYRHWHKLQYLDPPPGFTHETWWLAIKLARNTILKPWPLKDVNQKPFKWAMPDILLEMLHRIDRRASGSLAGKNVLPTGHEKRLYLLKSLEEEAITSSQIEGAATTRKIAKKLIREGRQPRDKSEQMILNNYWGMRFIAERVKQKPLDPALIFELHGILTENTLDDPSAVGRFRRDEEKIAVVDENGDMLHAPPRAGELPMRLKAMCDFANDDSESPFIHPVVRSILLHFWLAYDHPFVDGNGRTARALFYWSMARRGYWLIEYTSISRLLLKARSHYSRAFLYSEDDENDATYFLLHQCNTILNAIDELHNYVGRKVEDVRRSHEILRDSGAMNLELNNRQLALIRHAVDNPGTQYSISGHSRYHHISYQTARTDLLRVAEIDLLLRTKVGRTFYFIAPDDIRNRLEKTGKESG